MKTSAKSSHEHMWKELHRELVGLSSDRYMIDLPEIKLLCAVVVQAGIDHDEEYLSRGIFENHCRLLNIHVKFVLSLIKRAWRIEKSGVVWEFTPPLLEDDDVN